MSAYDNDISGGRGCDCGKAKHCCSLDISTRLFTYEFDLLGFLILVSVSYPMGGFIYANVTYIYNHFDTWLLE